MEHLTRLQCDNARLETELRLVKEQLAQAHAGTNYLVTAFATQQSKLERATINDLQTRLDNVLDENAQLRARIAAPLRITQDARTGERLDAAAQRALGNGETWRQLTQPERMPASPALTGDSTERVPASPAIIGDSTDTVPAIPALTDGGEAKPVPVAEGGAAESEELLSFEDVMDTPTPPNLTNWTSRNGERSVGLGIEEAEREPRGCAPTRPRYHGFRDFDRAYLLGQATYIEDLDDEEYEARWAAIAKIRDRRHSAEEWREYYEGVIRIAYRSKMKAKEVEKAEKEIEAAIETDSARSQESVASESGVVGGDEDAGVDAKEDTGLGCEEHPGVGAEVGNESGDTETDELDEAAGDTDVDEFDEATKDIEAGEVDETNEYSEEDFLADGGNTKPDDEIESATTAAENALVDTPSAPTLASSEPSFETIDDRRETQPPEDYLGIKPSPLAKVEPTEQGLTSSRWAKESTDPSEQSKPCEAPNQRGRPPVSRGRGGSYGGHRGARFDSARGLYNADCPPGYHGRPPCCDWPGEHSHLFHGNYPHNDNVARTVLISNIVPTATLADVLDAVHGGQVLSATFLETSKMRLDLSKEKGGLPMWHNAVMVTFLYAGDARAFADSAGYKHRIFFEADEDSAYPGRHVTVVRHIPTLVRPAPSCPTIKQIREQGISRVVYLVDKGAKTPEIVMSDVLKVLAKTRPALWECVRYPLRMTRDADEVLMFEFASIAGAAMVKQGMDGLDSWSEYGAMSWGFLPDPCQRMIRKTSESTSSVAVGVDEAMLAGDDGAGVKGEEADTAAVAGADAGVQEVEYTTSHPPSTTAPMQRTLELESDHHADAATIAAAPRLWDPEKAALAKALAAEMTKAGDRQSGRRRVPRSIGVMDADGMTVDAEDRERERAREREREERAMYAEG